MDEEKLNETKNELDLENMNLEEVNLDEFQISEEKNTDIIDLDNLEPTDDLPSNDILDNPKDLTLGLTKEQIQEFYEYLSGKRPRPLFAEKFFADGESRIRESNQLTTLMSLSFVPKLLAMQQSIIDSISTPENLKYLSNDDKIGYLQTLAAMSTKFNEIAMKYSQASKDFSGVPLIYRQLLDQLLMISGDKLPRLKLIPKLVDVPEDIWDRIVEISNIKE